MNNTVRASGLNYSFFLLCSLFFEKIEMTPNISECKDERNFSATDDKVAIALYLLKMIKEVNYRLN